MFNVSKRIALLAGVSICAWLGVKALESPSSFQTCDQTLCPKLGSLPKCSPSWYRALDACYAPPCNIRYIRDPAADCRKPPSQPVESRERAAAKKCEDTLCPKLGSFKKCSREWYKALDACYAPPCNIRYIRDPAADCPAQYLKPRKEEVAESCKNSLCSRAGSFKKCSPKWIEAVHSCYGPPCNIRYIRDPAADCPAQYLEPRKEEVVGSCEDSLCSRAGGFTKCSPEWIEATHSCYGPPCNIRYIRDPAADCSAQYIKPRMKELAWNCKDSLCSRAGNFAKCSPQWIEAIRSCSGPPCNYRWIRDPEADCHAKDIESREEAVAKTCEKTLCPKLGSFPKCSKEWYRALQACIDPPCNYRYLVDPAANCKKTTQPCPTQTVLVSGTCPPIIAPPRPCIEPDCIVQTTTTTTIPCKNPNCPVTPTVTSTRTCPPTKGTCRVGCATATATVTTTCKSDYK